MTPTDKVKRGGKRAGSGRKRGTPNKVTRALKEVAGEYSDEAIQTLVDVMRDPETPPAVKVAAADKLLDRAHGRPAIAVEATVSGKMDKALLEKIETEYLQRMEAARERQQQVLIERGLLDDGDEDE